MPLQRRKTKREKREGKDEQKTDEKREDVDGSDFRGQFRSDPKFACPGRKAEVDPDDGDKRNRNRQHMAR